MKLKALFLEVALMVTERISQETLEVALKATERKKPLEIPFQVQPGLLEGKYGCRFNLWWWATRTPLAAGLSIEIQAVNPVSVSVFSAAFRREPVQCGQCGFTASKPLHRRKRCWEGTGLGSESRSKPKDWVV